MKHERMDGRMEERCLIRLKGEQFGFPTPLSPKAQLRPATFFKMGLGGS
jgi:hypothetical protein